MKFHFIQKTPAQLASDPDCEFCGTECQLVEGDKENRVVLSTGRATLHPGDNFSRPLGRKISAGRAIRSYIPRAGRRDVVAADARRRLWISLFTQSPKTMGAGRV